MAQNENDTIIYLDSTFATTSNGNHTYYTIIKNSKIKQNNSDLKNNVRQQLIDLKNSLNLLPQLKIN